jgi:lipopolysaccharide/colanic/teichoic acid biosynthesis glycosyltransferase
MPKKKIVASTAEQQVLKISTVRTPLQEKLHAVHFVVYGTFKRVMDLTISAVVLVMLSPLFVITAIAIKCDSKGPVFFKQLRTGKDGKEFYIFKFRSMVAYNDVMNTKCEDQYTKVGKLIRRTSIDELPQFINVFLGQMSFIGPRPWIPQYWQNMNEMERGRTKVRPGITGLAAARGRNGLTIFEKINYDLEYVENYSLWMDMKVIYLTVMTVISGKGASSNKAVIHEELGALKSR